MLLGIGVVFCEITSHNATSGNIKFQKKNYKKKKKNKEHSYRFIFMNFTTLLVIYLPRALKVVQNTLEQ